MKKQICALLCASLLGMQVSGAVVDFQVGEASFEILDGDAVTEKTLEAPPFINDEWRTMVPLRAISEALGAAVDWNGEKREASVILGETDIRLYADQKEAFINGTAVTLDSAPVIIEGRTFVPLRFIGEALSCNVNYAASSRRIVIDNTEIAVRSGEKVFTYAELDALYSLLYQANAPMAEQMGLDTATLQNSCLEAALDTARNATWLENAFSDVTASPEQLAEILAMAESESESLSLPLDGLRDVVYEKLYYANGGPVAAHIMETVDIDATYRENFVCAKHVLVSDEETARTVYEKAVAGEDFDALVSEYGTDPGMASNPDGYVFTTGEMVAEFEAAAFAAAEGEITEPVKTTYGYHIIKREPLPALSAETESTVINALINERLMGTPAPQLEITEDVLAQMLGITQ